MNLSPESLAWIKERRTNMSAPVFESSDPDGDGVQEGHMIIEPRITFTVRPVDGGEERQMFVDGEPIADLDAAIKKVMEGQT
jgi:hypothetical protein